MKILSAFLFLLVYSPANAIIRYVTPGGGAVIQNGTSWTNAFAGTSLQAAIDASAPGDEVWVMTGTYFTSTTANRNSWFSMRNGVAIYGSFAGTEALLSQRNFSCGFTSVLSAEIGAAGNADNSYHVISNSSLNNTAILDGFTITGANANFDLVGNDSRSLGGGMLNNAANTGVCSPTLRNCLFTNNSALFGGGIFDHGQNGGNANPVITNCIFAFNNATGGGGAIDNFGYNGNASPIITNCIFYNNTATDRAGAMYCWGGGNGNASPTILNSVFVNNTSVDGGGLVCDRTNFVAGNSGTATPTIRNSIFWGNTASGAGPHFYILGGAGFAATYTLIDISNQNPPHAITGPGTGNLFTAPSFLAIGDADGTDNCWLTSDDGLQLQPPSTGIDAGDNTGVPASDIRGSARISNVVVDMGPYEFNAAVLPVNLVEFYGRTNKDVNLLYWKTASEQNSRSFIIERSADGIQFARIGELAAAGNSSNTRQYQFTDNQFTNAVNYYRLRQLDIDDRSTLSHIVLTENKSAIRDIVIYPNPVSEMFTINFRNPSYLNNEFILLNSSGQLIERVVAKNSSIQIDLSAKPAGIYLLVGTKLNVLEKIYKTD